MQERHLRKSQIGVIRFSYLGTKNEISYQYRRFKTMYKLGYAVNNFLDDYLVSGQTCNSGALSRTGYFLYLNFIIICG
jgi:hypothetical protein